MKSTTSSLGSSRSIASTTAIDPNQLLALCSRINENIRKIDKTICLINLRFATLKYVRIEEVESSWPVNFLASLVELCNLSDLLVKQLDDLHTKLSEDPQDSISFQVGSQQLAYFTNEWYENLTPKFLHVLDIADRHVNSKVRGKGYRRTSTLDSQQQQTGSSTSAELRVYEALTRLKQSMNENEQLIASISNNLELTKTTIESIYHSLQTTKVSLFQGQRNATESIGLIRGKAQTKLICAFICLVLIAILIWFALKIIGIL